MMSGRPCEFRAKLRVLVIDDDEDCQHFVREVMRSAGYAVDVARDGFEGIAKAAAYRYDLIICDVDMPHLSGVDTVRELRAVERREGRTRTPMVAFTAHGSAFDQQAIDAGIDEVLQKPMRAQALIQTSRRVVDDRTNVLVIDADFDRTLQLDVWCAGRPKTRLIKASGGAEACVRMTQERIDVVLVHVATDGIDGYGAARLLRADPERSLLPIIAFAEDFSDAARMRCLSNGYTDCFPKALNREAVCFLLDAYGNTASSSPSQPRPRAFRASMMAPTTAATSVDDEDVRALLPQFLSNLERDLEAVRTSLASGVLTCSIRIGHNLKGTGSSYGFPEISGLGAQLENAGHRGDLTAAEACVDALSAELEHGRTKIAS